MTEAQRSRLGLRIAERFYGHTFSDLTEKTKTEISSLFFMLNYCFNLGSCLEIANDVTFTHLGVNQYGVICTNLINDIFVKCVYPLGRQLPSIPREYEVLAKLSDEAYASMENKGFDKDNVIVSSALYALVEKSGYDLNQTEEQKRKEFEKRAPNFDFEVGRDYCNLLQDLWAESEESISDMAHEADINFNY